VIEEMGTMEMKESANHELKIEEYEVESWGVIVVSERQTMHMFGIG
jgi:hypothetical protein